MIKLSDYLASRIRTAVPVVVGALIAWLVKRAPWLGEWVDEGEINAWLVPAAILAYYNGVRWLEKRFPNAGWLLGLAKQPGYSDALPPAPAPADDPAFVDTPDVPVFVNDDLADDGEDERDYEPAADHETPAELIELSERLEELGMTPAAFAAVMGDNR